MSEDKKSLAEFIDDTRERFVNIAPSSIKFDAEKGFAIQLLSNNQYLMDAAMKDKASLLQAVTNVAAIGLSLNPAEKQAYLIPRNVKVGSEWKTRIFLEPSYMGLCKLATDSGSIEWVQASCVYASDTFTDNGFGCKPDHKYNPFDSAEKRGAFVGAYCVAKTSTGDYLTTIMSAEEVFAIREKSESYKRSKTGVWVDHFAEQAKKTVVRRAFKMWPRSDLHRLAQAVEISNENEGFEPLVGSPEIQRHNADQKNYFDQLISKNDCIGMYAFMSTVSDSIQASLYNSFEKGTVTKYKTLVSGMCKTGFDQFTGCMDAVVQAHTEGDNFAAVEVLTDLGHEAISLIKERTGADISAFIDDCLQQEKAA
jgi:recombination protein RecT